MLYPVRYRWLFLLCLSCVCGLAQPKRLTPPLHLDKAQNLIAQQRFPEALAEIRNALAANPSPEIQFQAGKLLRSLAELRFAVLSEAAPQSAALKELAGARQERMGRFAEALAEYRIALQLEPNRPGLRFLIGNVLWKMRDLEAAISELQAELTRSPHHSLANLRLGQAWVSLGQEDRAVLPLEAALAAMPQSSEARRDLGKAYRKLKRLQDARRQWEVLAAARPQDDQVHYLLASLYRELGEPELSRLALDRHRTLLNQRRLEAGKD